MREFFNYFFGEGKEVEFYNFSLAHFIPILVMIGIIYLIYKKKDVIANSKYEKNIALTIAFFAIICEMSYFWRLVGITELNPNPEDHLPITICGWVTVFVSFLVLTKNQTLFDICYFWVFAGTIFALITPTVITYTGPTRFRYYQFWVAHTIGYISIFYMIFVHKMRPTIKSLIKSFCTLAVLAGIALVANYVIGGKSNYLFLATTEDGADSIVNMLPSNIPLRLLVMSAAVTTLFFVSYLPWYIKDKKAKQVLESK